jgi:hypothetical protein
LQAVLHLAAAVKEFVVGVAALALKSIELKASLHITLASFELEVRETVSACSPTVPNASEFHLATHSITR